MLNYLKESRFLKPTPIQMQSLSCSLTGRDVIGLAETGSGKTLAYTLPLALWLKEEAPKTYGQPPIALIVVPTRELMQQVFLSVQNILNNVHVNCELNNDESAAYVSVTKYKVVGICGGISVQSQCQQISAGVDVVVGTPGRLLDLCERGVLVLFQVKYFVLDEVDRMLGIGLEEQLRKMVALVTSHDRPCQTLLFTATLPESLKRLARSAVVNPVEIKVGFTEVTAPNIQHIVVFLHTYEKPIKLLEILYQTPFPPVIVFASTIQRVDYLVEHLRKEQFHVAGLHSEKTQDYRFRLMTGFKDGKVDVLVATDLASRGLDIPEVTHVINYDLPDTIEDYIHRCGRASRMSSNGMATSFLTLDCKIAGELRELLETLEQPLPKELENVKLFGKNVLITEFGDRYI